MRVIFAGTPAFAAAPLQAIIAAGHELALVLTQPDRAAGRGLATTPGPVKQLALLHNLRIDQPASLKAVEPQQMLRDLHADIMVVVAYGLILPPAVLAATRLGAINVHASLLPRWRGAAPIQRAVEAGDTQTGITIMQLDEGLDTGPTYLAQAIQIDEHDTAGTVHDRLMPLGAQLVVECLHRIGAGTAHAQPQPEDGVTYAKKIAKAEAVLDWREPAAVLARRVRAFNPAPGSSARLRDQELKIWAARELPGDGHSAQGVVLRVDEQGPVVACGEGSLRLEELQRAGAKRMPAAHLMRGFPIVAGDRFELP